MKDTATSQPTQLSLEFAFCPWGYDATVSRRRLFSLNPCGYAARSTRASIRFQCIPHAFAMFDIVELYFRLFVALLDSVSWAENGLLIVFRHAITFLVHPRLICATASS